MNWTKIIATVAGAVIVALQGINLGETAGVETRIETAETSLLKQAYALEKHMAEVGEQNQALLRQLLEHAGVTPAPSPTPH